LESIGNTHYCASPGMDYIVMAILCNWT